MLRRALVLCGIFGLCCLQGCGRGGTPPGPGNFDLETLRGNWLVVGAMPTLGIAPPVSKLQPGVAMALDVISGKVEGNISLLIPCTNANGTLLGFIGGGTELEPVTPNADGTFVMEDVLLAGNTVHQLVISGTVPQTASGTWSGTYTLNNPNVGCVPLTGSYTATPFSQLTGTYKGSGMLSGSSATVTMSAVLIQGGPGSLDVPGARVNSENVVSGSVDVQGTSCFTSGTIVNNTGLLVGNTFLLQFNMSDGSMLNLTGSIEDSKAANLNMTVALVNGGACDKTSGFVGATLQKQ